jgi:hypothetical protein
MTNLLKLENPFRHRNSSCADCVEDTLELLRCVLGWRRSPKRYRGAPGNRLLLCRRIGKFCKGTRWADFESHAWLCRGKPYVRRWRSTGWKAGQCVHTQSNLAGSEDCTCLGSVPILGCLDVTADATPRSKGRVFAWDATTCIDKSELCNDLHGRAPCDATSPKFKDQVIVVGAHPIIKKPVGSARLSEKCLDCFLLSHGSRADV